MHGATIKTIKTIKKGNVYFGYTIQVNPLKTKRRPLYLKTQSVPRCKHFSSRL
jgi:hypothetical protein